MKNHPARVSTERTDPVLGAGRNEKPFSATLIGILAILAGCGMYDVVPEHYRSLRGSVDSMVLPYTSSGVSTSLRLSEVRSTRFLEAQVDSPANSYGIVPLLMKLPDRRILIDLDSIRFSVGFRIREIHPYLADFHHGVFVADYNSQAGDSSVVNGEIWTVTPMDSTISESHRLQYTLQVSDAKGLFLRVKETLFVQ